MDITARHVADFKFDLWYDEEYIPAAHVQDLWVAPCGFAAATYGRNVARVGETDGAGDAGVQGHELDALDAKVQGARDAI